jgi:hypothetical protein
LGHVIAIAGVGVLDKFVEFLNLDVKGFEIPGLGQHGLTGFDFGNWRG